METYLKKGYSPKWMHTLARPPMQSGRPLASVENFSLWLFYKSSLPPHNLMLPINTLLVHSF